MIEIWLINKPGHSGAGCSGLWGSRPACTRKAQFINSSIFQSIFNFSSDIESGNISLPLIKCKLWNSKILKNMITLMYVSRSNWDDFGFGIYLLRCSHSIPKSNYIFMNLITAFSCSRKRAQSSKAREKSTHLLTYTSLWLLWLPITTALLGPKYTTLEAK